MINVRETKFAALGDVNGRGNNENRWRIVNAYLNGTPMAEVGPDSETGSMLIEPNAEDDGSV